MQKEIDARGELCPKPVLLTKKELDNKDVKSIVTIVDNKVARDNVVKLIGSYGLGCIIDQKENDFYIYITKEDTNSLEKIAVRQPQKIESQMTIQDTFKDLMIVIGSDKLGNGEEALGKILMKSYIYTVKETLPWPKTIAFLNSGVNLTVEYSPVLDDLKAMEKEGVEIISCGTCLDYYSVKHKLQVGEIGNMYTIYEKMRNSDNTINIG